MTLCEKKMRREREKLMRKFVGLTMDEIAAAFELHDELADHFVLAGGLINQAKQCWNAYRGETHKSDPAPDRG